MTARGKTTTDLKGQMFGKWTVVEFSRSGPHGSYWHCICACGAKHEVAAGSLKRGASRSCPTCGVTNRSATDRSDVVLALITAGFSLTRIANELRMPLSTVATIERRAKMKPDA